MALSVFTENHGIHSFRRIVAGNKVLVAGNSLYGIHYINLDTKEYKNCNTRGEYSYRVGSDGNVYTCNAGNSVFKFDTKSDTETLVYSFNCKEDRTYPYPLYELNGKVACMPDYTGNPFDTTGCIILPSGTPVEPTTKLTKEDINTNFIVHKGYVYVALKSKNSQLCKYDDRMGLIKSFSIYPNSYCIGDDDYIYFVSGTRQIARIQIDGTNYEILGTYNGEIDVYSGATYQSIHYHNGNIYFLDKKEHLVRYRVKANEFKVLEGSKEWRDFLLKDNKAYLIHSQFSSNPIYSLDLNAPPTITPSSKSFGTFVNSFNTTYTVADPNNDKLTVIEKLDDKIINTRTNVASGSSYTISINGSTWDNISAGTHKITVQADDSEETCIVNYTFTVGNKAQNPPILRTLNNHRFLNEFYIEFKVGSDLDNNNQICTLYVSKDSNADGGYTFSSVEKFNEENNEWEKISTLNNTNLNDLLRIKAVVNYAYTNEKVYFKIKTYDGANIKYSSIGYCYINPILEFKTVPQECPFMPRFLTLYDKKVLDDECSIQVLATNNALDDVPVWEDITEIYKQGISHKFKNKVKSHENWAYSIHYIIKANDSINKIELNNFAIGVS